MILAAVVEAPNGPFAPRPTTNEIALERFMTTTARYLLLSAELAALKDLDAQALRELGLMPGWLANILDGNEMK